MIQRILILLTFSVLLSCSDQDDNLKLSPTTLNFNPVLNFVTDTIDIDITNSTNENSIYITYSDTDPLDIYKEKAIKFNSNTLLQTSLTHYDDTESRQIEVIGGNIYSISYKSIFKCDLNLNNNQELNEFSAISIPKTTKYNTDILVLSGKDENASSAVNMPILRFNTSSETYSQITSLPNGYRLRGDGITYNDKLYIFGGNDGTTNYADVNILDITTNSWSQQSLPFNVFESFTSLYNNSVIVAGNKNSDYSNAFIGIYDLTTNTYNVLNTSLDLNNITIRGITILNDEIYIAYADYSIPMPNNITIKVHKASLL